MNITKLTLVGLALVFGPLSACGSSPASTQEESTVSVAASFYPFEFIANRIGGEAVSVTSLTPPGAEPHDLELTARQVASLSEVDLLVYQSGFQPSVDAAVAQAAPGHTVDAAGILTLLTSADDHEAEEDHAAEEEDHDDGGTDPHTWLDPTNMVTIAEHVRDALVQLDPDQAELYQNNAESLIKDLGELDQEFSSGLASCAIKPFVTSHAAFGYLAERYDLEQVALRGVEPDVEPTAARIAEVQKIVVEHKVTTIFFETLVSPVVSQSLASDLGLATDVLDPLEGITDESRGADYLEVMRSNLESLQKANQCG